MPLNVNVPDDKVKYLSHQAQEELLKSASGYIDDIVKEAGRLESVRRSSQGDPEITATMIKDAIILQRNYPHRNKKKWWYTLIQIIACLSALWAGSMFSIETFQKDASALFGFIIVFTIAVVSSILQIMLGRSE